MTRIEAKVANEFEAGTDCTVSLKLKNRGTTETCHTLVLDGPGNSWARGDREVYNFESNPQCNTHKAQCTVKCDNFRPGENLQFKFHLSSSCIDHMLLSWVRVYFGRKYFDWSGRHWFNPSSNWMNFDYMRIDDSEGK